MNFRFSFCVGCGRSHVLFSSLEGGRQSFLLNGRAWKQCSLVIRAVVQPGVFELWYMALGKSLSVVRSGVPPPHESQRLCSSEVWLPQGSCNILFLTKLRRPFPSVLFLVHWGTLSETSCGWICTALAIIGALWAALAVMQSRTLDWWGCAEFSQLGLSKSLFAMLSKNRQVCLR